MKALPIALAGLVVLCLSTHAADEYSWPGNIASNSLPSVTQPALPKDFNAKYPEYFDWRAYISGGVSTSEQSVRARQACRILWQHLLAVERRERKERLTYPEGTKHAQLFDKMQAQWRRLCALECTDYAGPSTEHRGSGYKAYFPSFVARQILERIEYLNIER